MSRVDELPPDQRAALSLLLRQHKTYAEVASLLKIPEQAVHDRAHAALAVLAPAQARQLDQAGRAEIGDYLLGQQQNVGERLRTRTLLESSPAAGDWARAISAELAPLADGALPELPAIAGGAPSAPYPLAQAAAGGDRAPGGDTAPSTSAARSSRLGGALLLGVIALAAVVAIVVLSTKGSNTPHHAATSKSARSTGPTDEGRIALHPPDPASRSTGTVQILSEGGKRAFYIQAEHLPPSHGFFYAVWLYNTADDALPLSKAPAVGSSHKLAGAALLPSNASHYRQILLTRETSTRPRHPGHVVLAGDLQLNG